MVGFFRRCRCLVGGAIVDGIDYYNRIHESMHILTSINNRDNDDIEGFGYRWDDWAMYPAWNSTNTGEAGSGIPGGSSNSSRSISFKPLMGLFNQSKYIPLMWCPITLEFEVCNSATDPIVSPVVYPTGTSAETNTFTTANTSTAWQIQDVRIVCDTVTLDSALQNSYAEHVLSGKALPINYGTYVAQYQTISGGEFAVNISRSVSRLKTGFLNFDGPHTDSNISQAVHSIVNTFCHPMSGNDYVGGNYRYENE